MATEATPGALGSNDLLGQASEAPTLVERLRARVVELEAQCEAQREHLREMTEGRDYYMQKSRTLKASQKALRAALAELVMQLTG